MGTEFKSPTKPKLRSRKSEQRHLETSSDSSLVCEHYDHTPITRVVSLAKKQKKLSKRPGKPLAIVLHTTGRGVLQRFERDAKDKGWTKPIDAAQYVYTHLMNNSPHFVVDSTSIIQVNDVSDAAWHVGSARSGAYRSPRWRAPQYGWWFERWRLTTPQDLAGGKLWEGGSCNDNTIGIEVVHEMSPETKRNLIALIRRLCNEHGIPFDKYHVITHSDAHPVTRTDKNGLPWDLPHDLWDGDIFISQHN